MLKKIYKVDDKYLRILGYTEKGIYAINCDYKHMPSWLAQGYFENAEEIDASTLFDFPQYTDISPKDNQIMHNRFTIIAPILPYILDNTQRGFLINKVAEENCISHMTVRDYLCKYLSAQDIRILIPHHRIFDRELTSFEKDIRWALNKFYYTEKRNTLVYAYKMLLNYKYTDNTGSLIGDYPSFYQFRYYYQKTKSSQKEAIRRDGIKSYQRNTRPLLGDNLTEFAPNLGTAMLDSTVCDIYLINSCGQAIGRPILTACLDTNSQLCMGFSVGLEGGIYSIQGLLQNVITNKQDYCKSKGIIIAASDWPCSALPATMLTDKGPEYRGENLEQLTELGVKIVNLSSYRPDLKSLVEKFFNLIQDYFKAPLKGKGVIEPNYLERGSHDYRKDAGITLSQFETIITKCVIFYNSKRIIKNYPYSKHMLENNIQPYSNTIWSYRLNQDGVNLIHVDPQLLELTLLPRTKGKFTRKGLIVNKIRYKNEMYTEEYLNHNTVVVAYNPDDSSKVFLINNGSFIEFDLIESRYSGLTLNEIQAMTQKQKDIINNELEIQLQESINLTNDILAIRSLSLGSQPASVKNIKANRKKEINRKHLGNQDYE